MNKLKNIIRFSDSFAKLHNLEVVLRPCNNALRWHNELCLYNQGDALLKHWEICPGNFNISWRGFKSNQYLIFSKDILHAQNNGTFTISEYNHAKIYKIIINRLGIITSNE